MVFISSRARRLADVMLKWRLTVTPMATKSAVLLSRSLALSRSLGHVKDERDQMIRRTLLHFLTLVLTSGILMPHTPAQTRSSGPDTLIRNATVLTITRGTLTNTDVLLRNGKIAAVGKNLNAENARVIDGTGKFVMPGIVDCHSHSMLDAINEGSLSVTSM